MKDILKAKLEKIKNKDTTFTTHPVFKLGVSLACTLFIWSALVPSGMHNIEKGKEDLSQNKKELRALREISGQIYALERKLVGLDEGSDTKRKEESPLKQVERLAKESKVFGRISRITPLSKETAAGRTAGLTVEFEEIDMAGLTPFLHALTYRSILDVKEVSMNKQASKGDGILSARVVAWEL